MSVQSLDTSRERGQAADWAVEAWATGGSVADAAIGLHVSPAGGGTASFTFGCGSDDGSATCDLGTVDATSAKRQLQARVAIPLDAATVTSVTLEATASATDLGTDPAASASVAVVAPPGPVGALTSLPGATIPGVTVPGADTLSPGGSAAGLFPTLSPSSTPSRSARQTEDAAPAADTSPLSGAANPLGAEVAGLVALALAFILALTRLSIRKPAAATAGTGPAQQAPAATTPPATPPAPPLPRRKSAATGEQSEDPAAPGEPEPGA